MEKKYDLFISYSGNDNKLLENEKGWVINFARCLDVVLEHLLNRRPKILLSHDLDSTRFPKGASSEVLSNTAAFIFVLSPDYIKSKNFSELEDFMDVASHAASANSDGKQGIFKVLKTQVPFDEQSAKMQDLLSYDLCSVDPAGKLLEINNFIDPLTQSEFWPVLIDLAYDIASLISSAKNSVKASSADENKIIYLAEAGKDQMKFRNIIKRELQWHGYKVLPERPLPRNMKNLESTVRAYLDKSSFSIHLVGNDNGYAPQGSENTIVDIQNTIAADYNKTKNSIQDKNLNHDFSRLIWISPDLKVATEKQKFQVDQLKKDAEEVAGVEVVQTPLEVFKTILHDKARKELSKRQNLMSANTSNIKTRIYLIYTQENTNEIISLAAYLDSLGFEVKPTIFDVNIIESIGIHRENLVACDAAIIYYGKNNEQWLRSKLIDLKKAPGFGRTKPMLAQAVYFDGQQPLLQNYLQENHIDQIQQSASFDQNLLNAFMLKINKK